jgi:hypothetical protein
MDHTKRITLVHRVDRLSQELAVIQDDLKFLLTKLTDDDIIPSESAARVTYDMAVSVNQLTCSVSSLKASVYLRKGSYNEYYRETIQDDHRG